MGYPPPHGYGPPPGYGMYPAPPQNLGPVCPACGQHTVMLPYDKITTLGWIILIGGALVLCIPINFLGLLFKERGLQCQKCLWRQRN